jgi:hypothetical protein
MNISPFALEILLKDASTRDRTTARRVTLFEILHQESYLTREQIITRVEGKLGKGCFGNSAWMDTFFRDMQVVKRALDAAGYQLCYSRKKGKTGYYLYDHPITNTTLSAILDGSVQEVDRSQIVILKNLTFRQRFLQGCSITNLATQVVTYRILQKSPQLSLAESHRLAIQGNEQYHTSI